jgi:hypothetical protein
MAVLVNGIGYGPVQAPQDAMLIGGIVGEKNYILPYGNRMTLSIVDANTVRAADGVLIVSEGKRLQNIVGSYDDFTIPAGSAGVTKYFIVGYHLYVDTNSEEQVEVFTRQVSGPSATISQGSLINGDSEVFVSRAMVQQSGTDLTIIRDFISVFSGIQGTQAVTISTAFTYETGFTYWSSDDIALPYAAKTGRIVELYGAYKNTVKLDDTSGDGVLIGYVPAGFRPLRPVQRVQNTSGSNKCLIRIYPTGEIYVARSTESGAAVKANSAIRIGMTYISST